MKYLEGNLQVTPFEQVHQLHQTLYMLSHEALRSEAKEVKPVGLTHLCILSDQ